MPATVSVMLMTEKPPRIVTGTVLEEGEEHVLLSLPQDSPMPRPGSLIVLEFEDQVHPREVAIVLDVNGHTLRAKVRIKHQDQRDAARLYAGIQLSYCVLPANQPVDAAGWMKGGEAPAALRRPDPYMNFSLTGLQFEDLDTCSAGATVLFTLQLPRNPTLWRGVGRVVRVGIIPLAEREPDSRATHRIAIQFTELPEDARAALLDQTSRMQDSWLRSTLP